MWSQNSEVLMVSLMQTFLAVDGFSQVSDWSVFWTQLLNGRLGEDGILKDFINCGERGTQQTIEPTFEPSPDFLFDYGDDYDYYYEYNYYYDYNYIYDYDEKNGQRNSSRIQDGKSCLRECEWKHNPYFKSVFPNYIGNTSAGNTLEPTAIFITSPRIPKDTRCLRGCFPQIRNEYYQFCKDNIYPYYGDLNITFYDRILDCIVRRRRRRREVPTASEPIFTRNLLSIPRRRQEGKIKGCSTHNYQWFFRAANTLELALEFCLLACQELLFCDESQALIHKQLFPNDCSFLTELVKDIESKSDEIRAFGSSTIQSNTTFNPWLCSLKERGFRGRHRCGVTMLSGPPKQTILVSAAHCNYVCKDIKTDNIVEICCCRDPKDDGASCGQNSTQSSSYCPDNPMLVKAKPSDMLIVCGESNIDVKPEVFSPEEEVVLTIKKIINHPDFEQDNQEDDGPYPKGPYAGADIAVFHVDDSPLKFDNGSSKLREKKLYPACLPKEEYSTNRGIFAGWLDPEPYYRVGGDDNLETYRQNYLFARQVLVEEVPCRDPSWMNSNTYYPPGTVCYRDLSLTSCFLFGNSGSGVLRQFNTDDGVERFSWIGPLSLSKGCDLALITDDTITYAAENPGVFTNAICYLDWIANQYGLRMPADFKKPDTCSESRGDISDLGQKFCRASGDFLDTLPGVPSTVQGQRFTFCDFTKTGWEECKLFAVEGFAYNVYQCKDRFNKTVVCANNCKGVDPNAVVVGGTAIAAAAALSGLGLFGPALPVGLGLAVMGGVAVAGGQCPPLFCRVQNQCCLLVQTSGGLRCPSRC